MSSWRLLLTRTAPDCQLQADYLNKMGIPADILPLIEIAPLPETTSQRSQLLDFDRYTGLIVISKPAARLILDRLDYYWPQLPIQQTWFTVGKATAKILSAAGLQTHYPVSGDDSEALWQLDSLQQHLTTANCRMLIIKGQGGRTWLTEQLNLAGIAVDTIALYQRRPTSITEQALWQKITDTAANAIVISSGQALENLHNVARQHWHKLTDLTFFVPSKRIAEQAKQLAIKQIINCHGASLEDLISTLNIQ